MAPRTDLAFILGDDTQLGLDVNEADGVTPLDLTGKRIELHVLPNAASPDGDALFTLSTVTGGPPRITVTDAVNGRAVADLTNLLATKGTWWFESWVADVADPQLDKETWAVGLWRVGSTEPGPCHGSWVSEATQRCSCQAADFGVEGEVLLERWELIASRLLYARTGRRWSGPCVDIVRPCTPRLGGQSLDYVTSGGSRPIWFPAVEGCSGTLGCCAHSSVTLPLGPVRGIIEVEIGGVVVPADEYTLVDRRHLVRANGSWPCQQNLGLPNGEPGTWSITYEYGTPPPVGGGEMAHLYACELAKACIGDDSCRLPRRVQSITREGVTQVIIDPFDFLQDGMTGLYEVDAWVKAHNPAGIDRPGKVLNPDLLRTHRVL